MDRKKKTIEEMGIEIYQRGVGASGPELVDLVTKVMSANRDDPRDRNLRKKIGLAFRDLCNLCRRAS